MDLCSQSRRRKEGYGGKDLQKKKVLTGLPWVWGSRQWGSPWVWVWGGYGDDLPSSQADGDFMEIFNQPEITR